jgi:hypothetical protein
MQLPPVLQQLFRQRETMAGDDLVLQITVNSARRTILRVIESRRSALVHRHRANRHTEWESECKQTINKTPEITQHRRLLLAPADRGFAELWFGTEYGNPESALSEIFDCAFQQRLQHKERVLGLNALFEKFSHNTCGCGFNAEMPTAL